MRVCGEGQEEDSCEDVMEEDHFDGKRLLLAEDIELNREIAEEILTEMGIIGGKRPGRCGQDKRFRTGIF